MLRMPSLISTSFGRTAAAAFVLGGSLVSAHAAVVNLRITVHNVAPVQGVVVGGLNVGIGNGSFDGFNAGSAAAAPIARVAETGNGVLWRPAFTAADAQAVLGTVGSPLLAGQSSSLDLMVDTATNQYFSFAAMVVPSNDQFIGNDNPLAYRIFDAAGNLLISQINQSASDVWESGTEITDPAAAAFVGNAALHADQNGAVGANFGEFSAYNGLVTAAGYVFNNTLQAGTPIYRIDLQTVPEPGSLALIALSLGLLAGTQRLRRA